MKIFITISGFHGSVTLSSLSLRQKRQIKSLATLNSITGGGTLAELAEANFWLKSI
jgi:hypothetical protein